VPANRTSTSRREAYVLTLRPMPGVDGNRALRAALKFLLRRFGLKAVKIGEVAISVAIGGKADMGCCTAHVRF
jgi:hypothetical protein